jgi:ABC-type uncharacterized transport system fused permease/ATPase subunit
MTQQAAKPAFTKVSPKPVPEFIHLIEKTGPSAGIQLQNLSIRVPKEERVLIENATISIKAGERVGLTGPNGSGKSSLFRVIRGLDSDGSGKVTLTLPEGKETFCASQEIRKAALPLPGLLAYRHDSGKYTKEQYETVLQEAGLEHILAHLPWNAVKPENVLKVIGSLLDRTLEPYTGTLSNATAQRFTAAFCQTLHARFAMPPVLSENYTEEIHEQVIQAIASKTAEKLNRNPEKKRTLLLSPERTARNLAKALAEGAKSAMDGWLLQGHRLRLSGGEQQKLVFARMFLQGPENEIFLLDEVTSALKEATAHELYDKLIQKFPNATIIGIIHDTSLLKHFTHHLELGTDKKLTIKQLQNDAKPDSPALQL